MSAKTEQDGRADERLRSDSAEDVAQWLYANGHHDAAATVRNQIDVRNMRIRELQAALAQNVHALGDFVRLPDAERVVLGQQVAERVDEMENMRGEAVADRPAGFGIACTVTWTELHAAMTADGMTPPNKCGKAMSAWIGKVVRDYLHAERARVPDAFLVQVVKDGEAWEHRWYVPRWGDPDPSPMNGKPYCINGVEHPELGSYRVKAFVALEGKS